MNKCFAILLVAFIFFTGLCTDVYAVDSTEQRPLKEAYKFQFRVQSWQRLCVDSGDEKELSCDIPVPLYPISKLGGEIIFPRNEGEVKVETFKFSNDQGSIKGQVKLFAILPHSNSGLAPYFQVQFEMFIPERVFCIQSVALKSPMIFPPLTCTIRHLGVSAKQFGFSLIQE